MQNLIFFAYYLFAAVITTVLLAAFFGPWLAVFLKIFEMARKKPFFGLLSRQIQLCNLWFCSLAATLVLTVLASGYYRLCKALPKLDDLTPEQLKSLQEAGVAMPPEPAQMALLAGYFILLALLLLLGRLAWPKLRGRNLPQLTLALLIAICGSAAFAMTFATLLQTPQILNVQLLFSIFSWSWSLYPFGMPSLGNSILMAGKMLAGGMGIAANAGLCVLLLRRAKDDYGRDYYNFAAKHLARWLATASVITGLCGLGMMFVLQNFVAATPFELKGTEVWIGLVLYACCAIFWVAILRSPTPLRHKAGIWVSLAALVFAMLGHLLFLGSFYFESGVISGMVQMLPK